ncbi:TPA: hypothetical protein DIU27_00870 [Candidatus Collierbacteria bacterium]|nr:hypothetical protein [Candidatus Collierbacteria bacterium]
MLWPKVPATIVNPEAETAVVGTGTPTVSISPVPTVPPKTIVLEQVGVSGQSGTAVFQGDGDKTKIILSLVGKKFASSQPSHIHLGKCPTPGAVKYPLNNVINGKSETVVAVKIEDLFADLPLAVNVHESVEKSSVYTACGDLK